MIIQTERTNCDHSGIKGRIEMDETYDDHIRYLMNGIDIVAHIHDMNSIDVIKDIKRSMVPPL